METLFIYMKEIVFIASDHAGYDLKKQIIDSNNDFVDIGTNNNDRVDYPDYALDLIYKIKVNNNSKGILICGSGIKSCLKKLPDIFWS